MAEILAAFAAPHAVQAAYAALTLAWQQYQNVSGNKERCKVLIQRCQNLLIAVSDELRREGLKSLVDNLHLLENICISIRDIVVKLANRSFVWRLLYQDKIDGEIKAAEAKLLDAIAIFNISAHVDNTHLQHEIADNMAAAATKDQSELVAHLNDLAQNDNMILNSLQENHMRVEELLVALTKHVQEMQSPAAAPNTPTEKFIRQAVGALQRQTKHTIASVSVWQVTSLEVTFNQHDAKSHIGQGSFGNVYKGHWQGEVVAVKEMYTEDARSIDRNVLKKVHNEIAIWSRLTHPRIVQFYGACLEATRPFIISRFCPNGNILDYLNHYPYKNRLKLLHQVSLGMLYLHSQSVIHADLKGANILIDSDGKALIADFGISQLKDQTGTSSLNQTGVEKTKGTLRWMAPELLEGEKLNFPVDVYTFGITAWEVYTLEVPFSDIPERAFYRRVIDKRERPKCPATMDSALVQLVTQCWAHEIVKRPTFKTVSSSIWTIVTKQEREMGLEAINARNTEQRRKTELEVRVALKRQERKEEKGSKDQHKLDQSQEEMHRVRREPKVNVVSPPQLERPVNGSKVAEPRKRPTKEPVVNIPSSRPTKPRIAHLPLPPEPPFGQTMIPPPGPVIVQRPWEINGHPQITVSSPRARTQRKHGGPTFITPSREPSRQQAIIIQPPWEQGEPQPIIMRPPWEQSGPQPIIMQPPWEQGGPPIMVQPPWEQGGPPIIMQPPREQGGPQPIIMQPPWEQGGPQPIIMQSPWEQGGPQPIIMQPPWEQGGPQPITVQPPLGYPGQPDSLPVMVPPQGWQQPFFASPWDLGGQQPIVLAPPQPGLPPVIVEDNDNIEDNIRDRRAGRKREEEFRRQKPSWFSRKK